MTSRVFITTLTIVMFGAGYGARIWNERSRCPVPPAPPLLGEISTGKSAEKVKVTSPERPPKAAKIAAEIERLRPSIEAFRKGIEEMDAEMDRQLIALLKPEQMPLWDKMLKRRIEYTQKEEAGIVGDNLLTAEQIASLQQRPLYKLLAVVVVPQRLEWLTHDLDLDEDQEKKVWDILQQRREKFLTLIDSSPPPSLRLSRLAPLAQRLGEPKK